MEILIISKYFVVIALIIMMFAALRVGAYRNTSNALLGSSVAVVAFAVALLFIGEINYIAFFRDISVAWILFGFLGTVVFAITMGGDN
mgnify:FL=1